jgi:NAD(P)-dependent dehydrogenase (short-subunit alcohol dehydrogenase family)
MTGCAIVTGASRGFGRGIAEALAAHGRPVVTASRTTGTDVTDPAAVDGLVEGALERYGAVDVLVNNAGAPALLRELDAMTWEDWRRNFDVDLRGVFNTTTRVAPLMRARGGGVIVNVASAAANARSALHVSYSPAQAAIASFTRCVGAWLEPDGVAVHCLCPSLTPDGGVGRAAAAVFAAEEGIDVEKWLAHRRPHRLTAATVGDAVVELAGRDGGGAVWHLDADGLAEWDLFAATPVAAREG